MAAVSGAVPSLMGPLPQKQVVERSSVAERCSREGKECSHKEREVECGIRWLHNQSKWCSRNGSGGNIRCDI